jgi:hypothetical protein
MTKVKKEEVKVFQALMVSTDQLSEHPNNANKQNRHMHKELKESILDNGFDESLIVCPREDGGAGYYIVSGNHRYRAGKSLGMTAFPCVVREDWDSVEQQIQLVRRNYVRGKIDKAAFTVAVNQLSTEAAIGLDIIQERMGFEDADMFAEYYEKQAAREQQIANAVTAGGVGGGGASKVRMIDDLGLVLSTIFERFGDTAPYSFIVFPAGGKNHMYVQVTPALKRILETVAQGCVQQRLDMNIALGGLLAIGLDSSNFKTSTPQNDKIVDRGSELGNADLSLKKNE